MVAPRASSPSFNWMLNFRHLEFDAWNEEGHDMSACVRDDHKEYFSDDMARRPPVMTTR